MEYKKSWIYKLCKHSWAILLPILVALWVLVWQFPEFSPQLTEMALIGAVVAVTGLAAITYQYSVDAKQFSDITREQCDAARKLAETSEKTLTENKVQARQSLRPVIIPEIIQIDEVIWESWHGKLILRNGGNGPAMQLRIKTLIGGSLAWHKDLPVILMGQADLSDIVLSFNSKLASTANGNAKKLEYTLEVDWNSPYEQQPAKCKLPFTIIIDTQGHPTISVSPLEFEWTEGPVIHTG